MFVTLELTSLIFLDVEMMGSPIEKTAEVFHGHTQKLIGHVVA
jgi:hypothetical protein